MQITILPGRPHVNEGISAKTKQAYRIVEQAAHVMFPNGEGASFTIQPPRDAEPYKPGTYALDLAASFFVRDGKLSFSPKLSAATVGGTK